MCSGEKSLDNRPRFLFHLSFVSFFLNGSACSPTGADTSPTQELGMLRSQALQADFTTTVDEWHCRPGECPATDVDKDSLRHLPLAALCATLGGDCGREFRSGRAGESGEEFATWRIYTSIPPGTTSHTITESPATNTSAARPTTSQIPHNTLVDSSGNQFLYVRFFPVIDPDAVSRVDWEQPTVRANAKAAIKAAEMARQLEIETAAITSRRRLESETECRWDSRAVAAHAAYVWCPPGAHLDGLDFIDEISPVVPIVSAARGDDIRGPAGLQHGHLIAEEYDGRHGRNDLWSHKVKVAILDQDGFNKPQLHPAYNRTAHLASNSRIRSRVTCTDTTCSNTLGTVTGYEGVHGELALGAFSNVMDGQDGYVTTDSDREDRSYGAWDTWLYLRKVNANSASYATAIADSAFADIIVVNAIALGTCGRANSLANIRDAWNLAYSNGAIGVVAAGNWINRTNDDCTVNGIATRTDIVVVGASGDDLPASQPTWLPGRTTTPIGSWILDTQPLMGWHYTDTSLPDNCPNMPLGQSVCWSSALGGAAMRSNGSTPLLHANAWIGIDVVAPSGREFSPRFLGGIPGYGTTCCGTSYAAPEVASVLASVRDWTYTDSSVSGVQYPDAIEAGTLHVMLLLMGDGARGSQNPGAGTYLTYMRKDKLWGVGRLKARVFTDRGLDGPWGFGWDQRVVTTPHTFSFTISSAPVDADVDVLKLAMSYHEPNLDPASSNESAFVKLRLLTQTGCSGSWVQVASDTSFDPEKIISVAGSTIAGKCVRGQYEVVTLPPPASRQIFTAFYYEDRDREPTENLDGIE